MSEKIPKADRQENIRTHEGAEGAVIGRITNFEAGSATRSIEVGVDDLRHAVETDLADSYPSAYLWCDGQTLCVTDHRTPIEGEDAVGMVDLGDSDVTIKRTAVVRPSSEAVCALFDRELIAAAIDEIDADRQCVTVHVTPDFALVLEGERVYAVAHMQDTTIESPKGWQLVTDGGSISDPGARIYCTNCRKFRPRNDGDCSVCGERLYHVEGADA
jgi:hypothetical protein